MIERSIMDGEYFEYHTIDGVRFRLLGYVMKDGVPSCPTEKCDAFCCKTGALFSDMKPPCEYLDGLQCSFHKRGGISAKPYGCVIYPTNQADIDHMNRNADGDFRCHLRFEVA
jgi:hypothetical protein